MTETYEEKIERLRTELAIINKIVYTDLPVMPKKKELPKKEQPIENPDELKLF